MESRPQRKIKKILPIFATLFLLASNAYPQTYYAYQPSSQQAPSLSSAFWENKYNKLLQNLGSINNILPYLKPLVAASIIASTAYLLYKSFTNSLPWDAHTQIGNSTCQGATAIYKKNNDVKIKQIKVKKQSDYDGGGAASCGYHALKNGILIANALADNAANDLKDKLFDRDIIKKLFSEDHPTGCWREKIIKDQKIQALRNRIYKVFIKEQEEKNKLQSLYNTALDTIATDLAIELVNTEKENYELKNNDLITMIINSIQSNDEQIKKKAQQKKIIEQYINISKSVQNFNEEIKNSARIDKNDDLLDGEWIDTQEVETLIKSEQQEPKLLKNIPIQFSVVDNINLIGSEADILTPEIKQTIIPALRLENNIPYCHIFIIGNMKQNDNYSASKGHWITMVLHTNSQGTREYIISDSLNGWRATRMNDTRAKKIIDLIENSLSE